MQINMHSYIRTFIHSHLLNGCYKYHISQDLREFKAVRKVDGVLLNLTVFREVMYLCISISMSVCVCMIVEVVLTLLIQTLLRARACTSMHTTQKRPIHTC